MNAKTRRRIAGPSLEERRFQSRRRRDLIALGLERPQHVAGAVHVPISSASSPNRYRQPVEHTHLLGDLGGDGLEIGARTDMRAPACPRSLERKTGPICGESCSGLK